MTFAELFKQTQSSLSSAFIDDADFEATTLICHFFNLSQVQWLLSKKDEVPENILPDFYNAVEQRVQHRPLQYILGYWEFMGIKLAVGEGVLIPRDDTEVLVDSVYSWLKHNQNATGIDLCAGSGAISIALCTQHKGLKMTAVDAFSDAYDFLLRNLKDYPSLNITPIKADVLDINFIDSINTEFDFIVSNPPYIESSEIPTLQSEVQREPASALDGGSDGLIFYREITAKWKSHLKENGLLAFEIGESQAKSVCDILSENGFYNVTVLKDLAGLDRVVYGINKKLSS